MNIGESSSYSNNKEDMPWTLHYNGFAHLPASH